MSTGDVDADGRADLIVGSPGLSRVYAMQVDGNRLLWEYVGLEHARSGYRLCLAGDVDNDGVDEVVVSGMSPTGLGQIDLLSGASGDVIWTLSSDTDRRFGYSTALIHDVDGDGLRDLGVGSPDYDMGDGHVSGKVLIVSSSSGEPIGSFGKGVSDDRFGFEIVQSGDADDDGTLDIGVLALSGCRTSSKPVFRVLSANGFKGILEMCTSVSGMHPPAVATLADVDGDDVSDLAMSTAGDRVTVYSGASGHPLKTLGGPDHLNTFGGGSAGFGRSLYGGRRVGEPVLLIGVLSGGGERGHVEVHWSYDDLAK